MSEANVDFMESFRRSLLDTIQLPSNMVFGSVAQSDASLADTNPSKEGPVIRYTTEELVTMIPKRYRRHKNKIITFVERYSFTGAKVSRIDDGLQFQIEPFDAEIKQFMTRVELVQAISKAVAAVVILDKLT